MESKGYLITEYIDYSELNFLNESTEDGKKSLIIEGPFIQSEIKNRNKRIYRQYLVEREVKKLNETAIKECRSWMELDHPTTHNVSLKNACGLITELKMDGKDAIGKAKVMDSVNGRILRSCFEVGGKPGVSTRGVGTVSGSYVNEDWNLITIDAVASPSAPDGFVNGILESKEFIISDDVIVERAVEHLQEQVDRKYDSKVSLAYYLEFLNNIRKGF